MKKSFYFLLIASLGVVINFISANNSSQKVWKSAALSSDKTKMFIIKVTEQKETQKGKGVSVLFTATKFDTIETCSVQKEARIFLNDSNVLKLLNTGVIHLPDSIVPRWTHVFGKDIAVKRNINIFNNHLYLTIKNEFVDPINEDLIRITLIILLVVLAFNFIALFDDISTSWVLLWIGIFLSVMGIYFRDIHCPLFDVIFICSSLVFPTIIFLIIRTRKKEKEVSHVIRVKRY